MTLELRGQSPYLRVVLVGLDQLIAASSNFLVLWLCLTSLPTALFGTFSYNWNSIALFVVLSRALFGIPALLDAESTKPVEVVDISSSLTGTLLLGVLAALVTFFLYFLGGIDDGNTWILGLLFLAPLNLFQDQTRYLAICNKNVKFAILLDVILFSCILATVAAAQRSEFEGWHLIFGMACGYLLASVLFLFYYPISLSLKKLNLSIRLDFRRRSRLVGDAFLAWCFGLIAIALIRLATGDEGIGIYNGLVFMFGPVTLLTVFLTLGLQAEVVRTRGNLAVRHKALLVLVSISPAFWIILVNQTPEKYIEKLAGESTQGILANSIPFGIAASLGIGLEVLNLFMRAHEKFGQIVRLRFVVGLVFTLLLTISIYSNSGLSEIIWAMAFASILGIIGTAILLRKEQIDSEFA